MILFERNGDRVVARVTHHERDLLVSLAEQLVSLLSFRGEDAAGDVLFAQLGIGGASTPPLDPALARLLPDAYRGDEHAAAEHRRLTERGLVERKLANAHRVIGSLETTTVTLDVADIHAWVRTLTDLRLALAARLQIEEDGDEGLGDEAMLATYDWLGWLQGSLVEVIDE